MSRFSVWIDTPTAGSNVQDYSTFSGDFQRTNGFALGGIASSIRVNSALRQANLVAVALVNSIIPNTQLDLTSSVGSLTSEFSTYFSSLATQSFVTGITGTPTGSTLKDDINTLSSNVSSLQEIFTGVLSAGSTAITITDGNTSKIKANSAISIYTSVYGVNPLTVVVSPGEVAMTFNAQSRDITVGVKVDGTI